MAAVTRILAVAALFALVPFAVRAQGVGRSMDIDTSIRAAGMGGASTAVTWGDPNVWSNAASLGRVTGLRWEHGRTQLVPGLATDVYLESDRAIAGYGGIGVCFMGDPSSLGKLRLDYGLSTQTDPGGNVIGTFSSYVQVTGRGIGVSLPRLVDDVLTLAGRTGRLSEAIDLSAGMFTKHTDVVLAPASMSGVAQGDTRDWGVQGRLSPLRFLAAHAGGGFDPREQLLLDIGYGRSVLNANDAQFRFTNEDVAAKPTRGERSGWAVRTGVLLPPAGRGGWHAGFMPLVSLGFASDHEDNDAGGTGAHAYEVDRSGLEVSLANVITLRHGHVTDKTGEIDGDTSGWGVGLPLGPWAGFRYDEATIPQASNSGLPDVKRKGWTAWVDVVRIATDLRGGQDERGGGR